MEREFHIGASAELYAAGVLDAREQSEVEAHVAECAECLRRLGEAEETALALERLDAAEVPAQSAGVLPPRRRSVASWWLAVSTAAAFVVGFVIPHGVPRAGDATLAMIHSHFSHAQFSGAGPAAKVIYARDRSWYYVIVAGSHRYEVYGMRGARAEALGATQQRVQTSELFTRASAPFDHLELRERGATLETAAIR